MQVFNTKLFRAIVVLVSAMPVLLFAYLGQFSRMMSDDYCTVAIGQELGAWDGMLWWYNNWTGVYANFFVKSAWAQLDVVGVSLFPIVIVCCWVIGAVYLAYQILKLLQVHHRTLFWSLLLALVFVSTTLSALYSYQSFYWLAASIPNTFPIALLMIVIAYCIHLQRLNVQSKYRYIGILINLVVCFLIGGFSYVYGSFQAYILMILIIGVGLFYRKALTSYFIQLISAGLIGAIFSLIVQLSAPGINVRLAAETETLGRTNLSIAELVPRLAEMLTKILASDTILSGFVMLFLVASVIATLAHTAHKDNPASDGDRLIKYGQLIWIAIHLVFLPLLWNHTSDTTTILGRFSVSYFAVILFNTLMILGSSIIFFFNQIKRLIPIPYFKILILIILVAIFIVKQLFNIDNLASSYLLVSWFGLLYMLFVMENRNTVSKELIFVVLVALAILILYIAIVGAVLIGRGLIPERTLTFASATFILFGAVSGLVFGKILVENRLTKHPKQHYLAIASLVVFLLTAQIMYTHGQQIPQFTTYAMSWDARHTSIMEQKGADTAEISVNALPFDMADYINIVNLSKDPANRCAKRYYDVDSITVIDNP